MVGNHAKAFVARSALSTPSLLDSISNMSLVAAASTKSSDLGAAVINE